MLHLQVLLHHSVESVRDEIHHYVEVDFIRLLSISVEELAHLHTVGVMKGLEDLKLAILVALVLKDLLNSDCLSCLRDRSLEDDTERAVTNDLLSVVGEAL